MATYKTFMRTLFLAYTYDDELQEQFKCYLDGPLMQNGFFFLPALPYPS